MHWNPPYLPVKDPLLKLHLFQVKEVTVASEADDDPDPRHYQVQKIKNLNQIKLKIKIKLRHSRLHTLFLSTSEQRTDFAHLKQLLPTPSQSLPDITLLQKVVTDAKKKSSY